MASKRRIVMFNRVTADGFFAGADGNLNWVVPDAELDKGAVDHLPDGDTILFGRRTYDMFESFWPRVLGDPQPEDPHAAGRRSPAMRAMAVWINDAVKVVFSRTRKDVTWNRSRLVRELDPEAIEAMKRQPGKDMLIFGSGAVVSALTAHGLIDEYQFVVTPVLLGSGRSLMNGVSASTTLDLIEAKPQTTGNVLLRYAHRAG